MSMSSPSPAPGPRAVAATALRKRSLLDPDARMKDISDKPGGRKSTNKIRAHRPRPIDAFKDPQSAHSQSSSHPNRIIPSDPLAIRGAAAVGRLRRNAISSPSGPTIQSPTTPRPLFQTKVIEVWKECLKKRWNPDTQFLNLERLIDDALLLKNDVLPPGSPGTTAREASVIFKIASRYQPPVKAISLANNNTPSGQLLSTLARYLPDLANLSLQNNNLRTWRDIEYVLGRKDQKFTNLRELVLIGNPIRETEIREGRGEAYKSEIARRVSSLEMLDYEPITTISFEAPQASTSTASPALRRPTATTFPAEMKTSFITGVQESVVSTFLLRFFNLFDTQRAALQDAYHPACTFSYSANTAIPNRAKIQGHYATMPNQKKLQWSTWLGGSRNLDRMGGGVDKQVATLQVGVEDTIKAILKLPGTTHEVQSKGDRFCLDAWPVTTGESTNLFITIHGEFLEAPSEGVRSFDRSFVLAPAEEGSRASSNGWEVVILSDQLTVRGYSSHEAWRPGPMLVNAPRGNQPSGFIPLQIQDALNALPEPQRSLVGQVCQRTRLNPKFSLDCLHNNAWDVERAVANFEQVKATLGPDAFL